MSLRRQSRRKWGSLRRLRWSEKPVKTVSEPRRMFESCFFTSFKEVNDGKQCWFLPCRFLSLIGLCINWSHVSLLWSQLQKKLIQCLEQQLWDVSNSGKIFSHFYRTQILKLDLPEQTCYQLTAADSIDPINTGYWVQTLVFMTQSDKKASCRHVNTCHHKLILL